MKTKTKVLDLNKSTREIRKIDSFEAAHFIFSEKNDCNISIILRLAHSISFSLLKKAVNEIKKRNFLLRCRVNIDPLSFQETEKSPEILFIEKNQERDWESVASYEAHKLFNYQEGPLFRICYLAGKTSNEVILSMHHSISDGATLIAVVSEIIKYTLNPKSKYKKDLKIDSLDKLSIEKSVLKELNKEKAFSGRNITRKSLISHKRRGVTTGFIYKSLEMNKLKNFIKKIKVDGIAFQSLFSSIVLKEFFKCNRIQKVGFICPINVRKFFGLPKHSLGCKITLLEVLITKAQSLSCKNLAFFIDKEVNLLVENRYKLCQNIYDLVSPFKMNIGSDPIRLGVSNVGKIEGFRYLEELGVNVVYINGVLGNKFVFHPVICKFQEQVNFSFSFSKFFFTQKEAERLSNNIINYIKNY